MNLKDLGTFLFFQVLAIVVAGAVFSIFESKLVAGAVAGTFFVASGLYMARRAWRWRDKWQSLTLYPLFFHVFVISIPVVTIRFSQMNSDFQNIKIWGLEGPQFHKLSTTVFTLLILATVADFCRTYLANRKQKFSQ